MKNERIEKIERQDNNVLHAMYTKDSFVKVKQKLEIGKILFSFVNKKKKNPDGSIESIDCYMDANKKKNPDIESIDCYMDAVEFGAILMKDIATGRLVGSLKESKLRAEGMNAKYPKAVYTSPFGGCSLDANGKTTRDDSKKVRAVSRYFTIAPGARAEVIITAYQYPANITSTGAYVKQENSEPEITVMVSTTYNDLRKLQYKWSWLERDYMARTFSMDNMRSNYTPHTAMIQEESIAEAYNMGHTPVQPDMASGHVTVNNTVDNVVSQPSQPSQPVATQVIDTDDTEFLKCQIDGQLERHNGYIAGHIKDEFNIAIGKLWFPISRYDSKKTQGVFKIFAKKKDNDYLLVSYA